jgi:hypothetical protein
MLANDLVSHCTARAVAFTFRLHMAFIFGNGLLYGTQMTCQKPILESGRADALRARPNYVPHTRQSGWLARQTHVRINFHRNRRHSAGPDNLQTDTRCALRPRRGRIGPFRCPLLTSSVLRDVLIGLHICVAHTDSVQRGSRYTDQWP